MTRTPEVDELYRRDLAAVAGIEKLRFFPLSVVAGEGCWLTEAGGRRLLDLSATWTASGLGHGHPAVTEAVVRAVQRPPGAGALSAAHPEAVGLAEELLAAVPGSGDRRVYLGHAGSDANDVALRACRMATGRHRVVAFEHGYHGGGGLAMGVSGVHVDAGMPADPGAVFVPYPDPLRPHTGDPATAVAASVAAAEEAMAAGDVACLIVEPILSDGGLVVPPAGFLAALHAACRRHDVPMICDEVKMGLGRPGLLHAFQHDDVRPEIVTFGKALGGGLPLSAAVGPAEILDGPPAAALLTTAGNPVCAAAGRAVLRTVTEERLPEAAARAGARLTAGLREIAAGTGPGGAAAGERVGDVRGRGLAIGVDLVDSGLRRDPALARRAVYRAWQLGAVVHYVGGNVLEVTPPLVIGDAEIDQAVEILGTAIGDAARGVVRDEEVAAYVGW
ncbi:aspartate aminotransferase family protein [Streptoalloteichus hindustanus]|uniref:4-aminobutyrate aminotransferase n=1 Tax=Streptoalloteichus hindustanus TaxID=2017 RepID=A0A1M4Z0I9_STRHI|nr:aminotransferase class III-fold pyridoxal phosphate-dependent enzyme [Streptoalloteichus hindustanus]SHF11579.1 4-aminobutyrate aminotransferase [Streptoalloteichus hindustanus]